MADEPDRIISIIGPASTVDALRQELETVSGVNIAGRPWSGEPGTLDLTVDEPLLELATQFQAGATGPFARHLADAVQRQQLVLLDPAANLRATVGPGAGEQEIAHLLSDAPEVNPS